MKSAIRKYLLAFCIGCLTAIIFDTISPEYKYYSTTWDYTKQRPITYEMPKEAFLTMTKMAPAAREYKQVKQFNIKALLVGAITTVIALLIIPTRRKEV